jgi:hypothetical protein
LFLSTFLRHRGDTKDLSPLIPYSGARGRWVVHFRPRVFYPWTNAAAYFIGDCLWAPEWFLTLKRNAGIRIPNLPIRSLVFIPTIVSVLKILLLKLKVFLEGVYENNHVLRKMTPKRERIMISVEICVTCVILEMKRGYFASYLRSVNSSKSE